MTPVVGKVVLGSSPTALSLFKGMAKTMGWKFVNVKKAKEPRALRKTAKKHRRVSSP